MVVAVVAAVRERVWMCVNVEVFGARARARACVWVGACMCVCVCVSIEGEEARGTEGALYGVPKIQWT